MHSGSVLPQIHSKGAKENTSINCFGNCDCLLFPASEKCSTNRNHFLLEAYKEVHKPIAPHISKQITTTSLSRDSGAQVSVFQSPFSRDDLITATLLPKNYLLHPISSSKGISIEPAHETSPSATVVG